MPYAKIEYFSVRTKKGTASQCFSSTFFSIVDDFLNVGRRIPCSELIQVVLRGHNVSWTSTVDLLQVS